MKPTKMWALVDRSGNIARVYPDELAAAANCTSGDTIIPVLVVPDGEVHEGCIDLNADGAMRQYPCFWTKTADGIPSAPATLIVHRVPRIKRGTPMPYDAELDPAIAQLQRQVEALRYVCTYVLTRDDDDIDEVRTILDRVSPEGR